MVLSLSFFWSWERSLFEAKSVWTCEVRRSDLGSGPQCRYQFVVWMTAVLPEVDFPREKFSFVSLILFVPLKAASSLIGLVFVSTFMLWNRPHVNFFIASVMSRLNYLPFVGCLTTEHICLQKFCLAIQLKIRKLFCFLSPTTDTGYKQFLPRHKTTPVLHFAGMTPDALVSLQKNYKKFESVSLQLLELLNKFVLDGFAIFWNPFIPPQPMVLVTGVSICFSVAFSITVKSEPRGQCPSTSCTWHFLCIQRPPDTLGLQYLSIFGAYMALNVAVEKQILECRNFSFQNVLLVCFIVV